MENFIFCAEYLDFFNSNTSYFYELSNVYAGIFLEKRSLISKGLLPNVFLNIKRI